MSDVPTWETPDGKERKLGFNPDRMAKPFRMNALVRLTDIPDFPDSEIVPFDLADNPSFAYRVKDQGSIGACTGYAMTAGMERLLWQSGYGNVRLSPDFLYALACNGIDRGAYLDQVCDIAATTGTPEERFVKARTFDPRKLTAEAKADAANWKVELTVAIPQTWRQFVNAVNARGVVYHSVAVNSNFDTLDTYGVPGNRSGVHNHAVLSGFGLKRTTKWGWQLKMPNSWSEKWGQKGFAWLAEKNIAGTMGQAIAIFSVNVKRDLNPPEPV